MSRVLPLAPTLSLGRREQLGGMRIGKSGNSSDEFEFAVAKLLMAIIGKALDEQIFSGHYLREVEGNVFSADAPGLGMARMVHNFRRVEQRLRGHAATQDAKAADFFTAFDDDSLQTGSGGGPSRSVAATPPADDSDVIFECVFRGTHRDRMGRR